MRFTVVILSACLCLNAYAQDADMDKASDDDIVAAAERLTAEAKSNEIDTSKLTSVVSSAGYDESEPIKGVDAKAAQPKTAEQGTTEANTPVFTSKEVTKKAETGFIWRLVGSLAFVAAVGGIMIFAGKRWAAQRNKGGEKARIEMMHQFQLGPKRSVALIRVAGETMLIGCTDHSVNLIKSVSLIDDELEGVLGKDFNNFLEDDFTMSDMRTANTMRA